MSLGGIGASRFCQRCVYYLQVRTTSPKSFLCRLLLTSISVLLATGVSATRPERIVSINQCADELLLNLADPQQIQSVSHYVKNPQASWDAQLATDIPGNRGLVEEVVSYAPDLVLVGDFNARSTVNLLRELGLRVEQIPHPRRMQDAIAQIQHVAALVGHPARAAALTDKLSNAMLGRDDESLLSAIVYQPNGFTTGKHSVVDDVLRAAGLTNLAASWGGGEYSYFPMERLLWRAPALLVLDPQTHDAPSLAHQVLEHRALRGFFGDLKTVTIPPQAWACGSHHLSEAVALLRAAAAPLRDSRDCGARC